ncbi:MAG TPA: hypothetical protein VFW07_09815 [Parafilimonas sp.]|nr:hypothetical protein [Parafilimonas sp.]
MKGAVHGLLFYILTPALFTRATKDSLIDDDEADKYLSRKAA